MKHLNITIFSLSALLAVSARAMESDLKIEITETQELRNGMRVCTVAPKDLEQGFERASKGMSFSFQTSETSYTLKAWQIAYMKRLIENNKIEPVPKNATPQCYKLDRDIYLRFFGYKKLHEAAELRFWFYNNDIVLQECLLEDNTSFSTKFKKVTDITENMAAAYGAPPKNLSVPTAPSVAAVNNNSAEKKPATNAPSFSLFKAINRPIKSALVTAGAYALLNQSPFMYSFEPAISFCAFIPVWHWAYKQYRAACEARTYSAALIHGASSMACGLIGALFIGRQLDALSSEQ